MKEPIEDSYKELYNELKRLEPSYTFKNPTNNPMLTSKTIRDELMNLFSRLNKFLNILDKSEIDISQFDNALTDINLNRRKLVNIILEANNVFERKKSICIDGFNSKFEDLRIVV